MQLLMEEVLPVRTYKEVETKVKMRLRAYPRIEAQIRVLERQALGFGLYISVDTSKPIDEREDKLQALHRQLRDLPEHLYLSEREQGIVSTVRAYLDTFRQGTRSQLYDVKSSKGDTKYDNDQITQATRAIQTVIDARSNYRLSTDDAAIERAEYTKRAELAAEDYRAEKDLIDEALDSLKKYRPHLEKLLRLRYVEDKSVVRVCNELPVAARTYARWKEEAICEFATITGMWGITRCGDDGQR